MLAFWLTVVSACGLTASFFFYRAGTGLNVWLGRGDFFGLGALLSSQLYGDSIDLRAEGMTLRAVAGDVWRGF